jgi:hypothetical protein
MCFFFLHCHVCYLEGYHGTLGLREKLDTHTVLPWDMVMGGPPHLFSHLNGGMSLHQKKMFITFSQGFHPQLSAPDQPKKTENSSELKIQLFPTKSVVDLVDLPLRLIFGMNVGKQVYHTWTTSELAN